MFDIERVRGLALRAGLLPALLLLPICALGCQLPEEIPYIAESFGEADGEKLGELRSALEELERARRQMKLLAESLSEAGFEDEPATVSSEVSEDELEFMALKEAELSLMDYSGLRDEVIESAIEEIRALRDTYARLEEELRLRQRRLEEEAAEERAHISVDVHIRNSSGYTITGVRLSKGGELSAELLPEGAVIADGETLLGLRMPLYLPITDRELVLTDIEGTEHRYIFEPELNMDTDQPRSFTVTVEKDGLTII